KYAQVALESEAGKVAIATVRTRNIRLNESAFALGQLVGAGVLDRNEVVSALAHAANRAGLGQAETDRTITSGVEAGMKHPRKIPGNNRVKPSGDGGDGGDDDPRPVIVITEEEHEVNDQA